MVPPFKPLCSTCGVIKTHENCNERSPDHFMPKCRVCQGSASPSFTKTGKPRRQARGLIIRTSRLPRELAEQVGEEFLEFPMNRS